jgi:hypothetical protein
MIDIIYISQVIWDKKEFINFYLRKIDYSKPFVVTFQYLFHLQIWKERTISHKIVQNQFFIEMLKNFVKNILQEYAD